MRFLVGGGLHDSAAWKEDAWTSGGGEGFRRAEIVWGRRLQNMGLNLWCGVTKRSPKRRGPMGGDVTFGHIFRGGGKIGVG